MKLAHIIPTQTLTLFTKKKSKKSRSISRSSSPEPLSFTSTSSSSDNELFNKGGSSTPTTVLPQTPPYSGKIKKEELEELLSRLGAEPPSQDELNLMLSQVDMDVDGCISLEEFYAAGEADLREAFEFFDGDGDGRITAEELFGVFEAIGGGCTLEECRRMIEGVDRSGEGFVGFEDFCRMMDQHQR